MQKRLIVRYEDIPTEIIHAPWQVKAEFDEARLVAKTSASLEQGKKRKRADKTPWKVTNLPCRLLLRWALQFYRLGNLVIG